MMLCWDPMMLGAVLCWMNCCVGRTDGQHFVASAAGLTLVLTELGSPVRDGLQDRHRTGQGKMQQRTVPDSVRQKDVTGMDVCRHVLRHRCGHV